MTDLESRPGRAYALLTFACGVAALGLVGSGLFGDDGVRKHERLGGQLAELAGRRQQLEAEQVRLAAEAKALRESRAYVEWVIRQDLGWVAPGERVILFDR